ncbi:MAG: AIR synthase family protein [Anaerolineales bacterium]|nr:AIR synthase family protein [Anaerolineales bacterium]
MNNSNFYPLGKLPAAHLAQLLERYGPTDPSVIVGPRIGEDTAVLEISKGHYLVAKSDPITFATEEIGWYAVNVNANDVACSGGAPRWWIATLILPEGQACASLVDTIFEQMGSACQQVGAQLVGGHTEITYGIDRPLVIGTMLGQVPQGRVITTAGARPGDVLILTKGIAVEGTAIISREKRQELAGHFDSDYITRCAAFLHNPGISVVRDAGVAINAAPDAIHAMHDPTEGGVATSLYELAGASGHGLELDGDSLPVYPETVNVCRLFGLDPLGLIASGSLLISADPEAAGMIVGALESEGIDAAVIGRVLSSDKGVWINRKNSRQPLPTFARDEIARLFG